jgi:hypothetical protein
MARVPSEVRKGLETLACIKFNIEDKDSFWFPPFFPFKSLAES